MENPNLGHPRHIAVAVPGNQRSGSIAGARLIPLSELKDRLAEVSEDRPVITVCHAGMRSGQATVIVRWAGFARVANLRGGTLSWQRAGLPVVLGPGVPAERSRSVSK